MSFRCRGCGEKHDELSMAFHAEMPQAWMEIPEDEEDERGTLTHERCKIDGTRLFLRGEIEISVEERTLTWGAWYEVPADKPPALDARLATSLSPAVYPETLGLPVRVHARPGRRPLIEVVGDHPLAVEQRGGITRARLEEIWGLLLHQDDDEDELDREQLDDREDDADA